MSVKRPMPLIDNDNRTFWEGVKNHKLIIQYCGHCNCYIFYPRYLCPHCFGDQLTWKEVSGRGKIYSFTEVHRHVPPFDQELPYVVGLIELEEGVRMVSRIKGDIKDIKIDAPVSVVFETIDDELTLPYFQLV